MMSSLMGVLLGHVMDGLMVNVIANNEKLFRRSENMVMEITGCLREDAANSLRESGGQVKEAVLIMSGAKDLKKARNLLERSGQNLRLALAILGNRPVLPWVALPYD